jgi:hypothetical protein
MNRLNNSLKESKISLSYFGAFSDEITNKLISISEFYLQHKSEIGKLKNKVSFLIAECFQNIVRHSDTIENNGNISHSDFFQLNVLDDRIVLASCNLIMNEHIKHLENKLIQINSFKEDELKKLYTDLLKNGELSQKGGAGLGLIEMARKSGLPLKFKFNELANGTSQFFLSLEIIQKAENKEEKIKIDDIEQFYQRAFNDNVLIQYKGDFSFEIINPILDMIKHNFKKGREGNFVTEKRVIITLIETIENISKHGKLVNGIKEGILTICKTPTNYILETGNYVDLAGYEKLNKILSTIKKLSLEELNSHYKKIIMESEITDDGNSELGFVEIARKSNSFSFEFEPINQNEFFYKIKISV